MSHYTVAVVLNFKDVGELDERLEPFYDGKKVRRYRLDVVSKEEIKDFVSFYKKKMPPKERKGVTFESLYRLNGEEYNGNAWVKKDGVLIEYSNKNKNARWDWYVIGGRWKGMLKLKDGCEGYLGKEIVGFYCDKIKPGHFDIAKLSDIDFSIDEKSEEYKDNYRFYQLYVEEAKGATPRELQSVKYNTCTKEYYANRYGSAKQYADETSSINTTSILLPNGKWIDSFPDGSFGSLKKSKTFREVLKPYMEKYCIAIVDYHI